jgi:hypothetical protein
LDSDSSAYAHTNPSNPNLLGEPIPGAQQPSQPSLRRRNTNPVHIGIPPTSSIQESAASSVGETDSNPFGGFSVTTDNDFDSETVLKHAINAFRINLGLEDTALIKDVVHLRDVPAGAFVAKEDSQQVIFNCLS